MKRKIFAVIISFVFIIGLFVSTFTYDSFVKKNAGLIGKAIAAEPTCSGDVVYCVSMQEKVYEHYDENCSSDSWATLDFHPLAC